MTNSEFIHIYMPYSRKVYAFAYNLLRRREDAEDVMQEVYMELWKLCQSGKPPEKPLAFMLTTTRNKCLNIISQRRPMENETALMNLPDGASDYANKERLELVLREIDRLPSDQREIIHLRAIQGLEFDEISAIVGKTEGAIRVILSRARKVLKEQLQ